LVPSGDKAGNFLWKSVVRRGMHEGSIENWARNEFARARLGDTRRTKRVVKMTVAAARRPSGRVSAVFNREADREGAYDFLENPKISADAVAESMFSATAARARTMKWVYVPIDGSALSLSDENGAKGFGPVGSPNAAVSGLKVMNALAVAHDGVPLGLLDQIFWNRPPTELGLTTAQRTAKNMLRSFHEKETAYFVSAAENAIETLASEKVRAWIVIDREADNRDILLALHETGCSFTIRGRWDRRLFNEGKLSLDDVLDAQPSLGAQEVEIARTGRRPARRAVLDVRAAIVTLRFEAKSPGQQRDGLRLYAVRARELSIANGVDWLLLTNVPVVSSEHARAVIDSYRARWRIEEFHRTWKQGECNVEDAQLRSIEAVKKWATILGAVAMRIERLKYFSRTKPDEPASVELGPDEIEALKLDQRNRGKLPRRKSFEMPSIRVATRWVAELGGWIGVRNGEPGSITIARGLERLGYLVEGIALARQPPQGGRRKSTT
jgi:hypothetical protein